MKRFAITRLLRTELAIVFAAVLVVLILGSAVGTGIVRLTKQALVNVAEPVITVTTPAPVIVERLQALNRLETVRQVNRHVVEAKSQSLPLPQFLVKDKLLMLVQTETIAGIDFTHLSEDDVKVTDRSVILRLPEPKVFSTYIQDEHSRVINREKGWFVRNPDKDLERYARLKATSNARKAAIKSDLLSNARSNAEDNIRGLLKSLGFEHVEIKWKDSAA